MCDVFCLIITWLPKEYDLTYSFVELSLFVYIKCAPYEKPDKACFSNVLRSLTKSGINIILGKFRFSLENN